MIEVKTTEQAHKLVKDNKFVSFIWHSNSCPVCEYFLEDLQGIEEDCPEFVHVTINKDDFDGDTMFTPSQFPWTFIFKDGDRISSPAGQTPRDNILNRYKDIINGTFKSQEQLEKEQLTKMMEEDTTTGEIT